jgi:PEP-CTERM motif
VDQAYRVWAKTTIASTVSFPSSKIPINKHIVAGVTNIQTPCSRLTYIGLDRVVEKHSQGGSPKEQNTAMRSFRTTLAAEARSLILLLLVLGAAPLCSASAITYYVNQTVGAGGVTGFIETEGTSGVLGGADILTWNLLLNDGATTFDLLGPLSGANSQLHVEGSDLSATTTQLLFDFSGTDSGFFLIQSPVTGNGNPGMCFETATANCAGPSSGEAVWTTNLNLDPAPPQFTDLSVLEVIGIAGPNAPEPSTFVLLGAGIALLGFCSRGTEGQRGR